MSDINIINSRKEPIKLTSYQKNEIYRNAKILKEKLKDSMCSKRECSNPTQDNVNKMLHSEFKAKHDMITYKNSMKAIGADSRDINPENIRRR